MIKIVNSIKNEVNFTHIEEEMYFPNIIEYCENLNLKNDFVVSLIDDILKTLNSLKSDFRVIDKEIKNISETSDITIILTEMEDTFEHIKDIIDLYKKIDVISEDDISNISEISEREEKKDIFKNLFRRLQELLLYVDMIYDIYENFNIDKNSLISSIKNLYSLCLEMYVFYTICDKKFRKFLKSFSSRRMSMKPISIRTESTRKTEREIWRERPQKLNIVDKRDSRKSEQHRKSEIEKGTIRKRSTSTSEEKYDINTFLNSEFVSKRSREKTWKCHWCGNRLKQKTRSCKRIQKHKKSRNISEEHLRCMKCLANWVRTEYVPKK
jgi:hypothetical protein